MKAFALITCLIITTAALTIAAGLANSRRMWHQGASKSLVQTVAQSTVQADSGAILNEVRKLLNSGKSITKTELDNSDVIKAMKASEKNIAFSDDQTDALYSYDVEYILDKGAITLEPLFLQARLDVSANQLVFDSVLRNVRLGEYDPYQGVPTNLSGVGFVLKRTAAKTANSAFEPVDTAKSLNVIVRGMPASAFTVCSFADAKTPLTLSSLPPFILDYKSHKPLGRYYLGGGRKVRPADGGANEFEVRVDDDSTVAIENSSTGYSSFDSTLSNDFLICPAGLDYENFGSGKFTLGSEIDTDGVSTKYLVKYPSQAYDLGTKEGLKSMKDEFKRFKYNELRGRIVTNGTKPEELVRQSKAVHDGTTYDLTTLDGLISYIHAAKSGCPMTLEKIPVPPLLVDDDNDPLTLDISVPQPPIDQLTYDVKFPTNVKDEIGRTITFPKHFDFTFNMSPLNKEIIVAGNMWDFTGLSNPPTSISIKGTEEMKQEGWRVRILVGKNFKPTRFTFVTNLEMVIESDVAPLNGAILGFISPKISVFVPTFSSTYYPAIVGTIITSGTNPWGAISQVPSMIDGSHKSINGIRLFGSITLWDNNSISTSGKIYFSTPTFIKPNTSLLTGSAIPPLMPALYDIRIGKEELVNATIHPSSPNN